MKKLFTMLMLVLGSQVCVAVEESGYWSLWDSSAQGRRMTIDHSSWDGILTRYVVVNHPSGINRFRYADVTRADEKLLNSYIDTMSELDPRTYSRLEQKAYWINVYNALVVQQILNEYPVAKITDIDKKGNPGPWDDYVIKVLDQNLSLNDIEHRILRPIWKDHKIHFALACGGLSCPSLQPKAYTSRDLKARLRQAGRDFIGHPRGLQVSKGVMTASSIFNDYRDDFAKDQKALLKLLAYYSEDKKALYLLGFKGKIKSVTDWRINAP